MKCLELLVAVWLAAPQLFAATAFEVKSWRQLSSREVTPLGQSVLRARWWRTHGESEHFIYHGASEEAVAAAADQAEYAYRKAGWYLGLPLEQSGAKGHVFVVSSPGIWDQVLRGGGRRRDSLSMQVAGDLFVQAGTNGASTVVRLCHEVVHFRLWQAYGDRIPVWLDEGLAAYVGWNAADAYQALKGKKLVRTVPGAKAEALVPLDQLTQVSEYPGGEAAGQAFYREVEELIVMIAAEIGDAKLGGFVKAVAGEGIPWKDVLRSQFKFSDGELVALEEEVLARSKAEVRH
ncbi:MAG: hypothetical protein V1873_06390 [Verrucomicrobiota bacterium]